MDLSLLFTVIVTIILMVLVFNLKSPGKRIEHSISPKGALNSAVVMRSIGQLLGPPLIGGNKITALNRASSAI